MITVQVALLPYGLDGQYRAEIASLDIIQVKRPLYRYILRVPGQTALCGSYNIDKSAHRNPWHHIAAALAHAKPQLEILGIDYCTTRYDDEAPAGDQ